MNRTVKALPKMATEGCGKLFTPFLRQARWIYFFLKLQARGFWEVQYIQPISYRFTPDLIMEEEEANKKESSVGSPRLNRFYPVILLQRYCCCNFINIGLNSWGFLSATNDKIFLLNGK